MENEFRKDDTILMHKDIPLIRFNFNSSVFYVYEENRHLLPVVLRDKVRSLSKDMTVQQLLNESRGNYNAIVSFLGSRVLNISRENAKKLLNAYNLSQSPDLLTRAKIALTCKAVSMIDSYWVKPVSSDLKWTDMNPRTNSLNKIVAHIALLGESFTLQGEPHTPELTGQGAYAKAWIRKEDGAYLLKKSTALGKESEIEVSISKILDCFNVRHIEYKKDNFEGNFVCSCKNMADEGLSIATAEDVQAYCNFKGINFMSYALKLDGNSIYKMCIVDYLVSNADRHSLNWGFYMNNHTGNILCCHPLFDHNNAFEKTHMQAADGERSLIFSGKSKREAAEYSMKKCKLKATKPVTRDMFLNDEMYESFMTRAVELGIYKERKVPFAERLSFKKPEKYEPVHLYPEEAHSQEDNIRYMQKMIKLDNEGVLHKNLSEKETKETEKDSPGIIKDEINMDYDLSGSR